MKNVLEKELLFYEKLQRLKKKKRRVSLKRNVFNVCKEIFT